jgi:hypothetical protein
MEPTFTRRAEFNFVQPEHWDEAKLGACAGLEVRAQLAAGEFRSVVSTWKPSALTICAMLNAGGVIEVTLLRTHAMPDASWMSSRRFTIEASARAGALEITPDNWPEQADAHGQTLRSRSTRMPSGMTSMGQRHRNDEGLLSQKQRDYLLAASREGIAKSAKASRSTAGNTTRTATAASLGGPTSTRICDMRDTAPNIYTCPICRTHDRTRYARCDAPNCPDGRDQYWWQPAPDGGTQGHDGCLWLFASMIGIGVLVLVVALTLLFSRPAHAAKGFDPNTDKMAAWMEKLMRPDFPYEPPKSVWPCCGKADAYPVSSYFVNPDGSYSVVIADGSSRVYPDGTIRPEIRTGRTVIVPSGKVNDLTDDLDNPTDFSWVFLRMYEYESADGGYMVYCFIRHPQGN